MTNIIKKTATIVILLFAIITFSSCDDRAINPFENIQGLYSVYGALEVGNSENYVRVRRVDTPLLADSTSFKGVVTFTNLETGESEVLQDSVINYNGNYTHNFKVNELIMPDQQYKIEVESPEGEITESVASTPTPASFELVPDPFGAGSSVSCNTEVEFTFENVKDPEFVRMDIGFDHGGRMNWATLDFVDRLEHVPGEDKMTVVLSPTHMLVEVFPPPLPDDPFIDPKTLRPTVNCFQVSDRRVHIRYYHMGKEWNAVLPTRTGSIDIESDAVNNGLGFFGAYYKGEFSFQF